MTAPLLEVNDLCIARAGQEVVSGVSFALQSGSDTAVIGPNGAGKSTLVQALVGLLPHHGGTIRLLGHTLPRSGRLPREVRDQVAYLPQKLLLDGRFPLSVSEFVRLGCSPRCHHREAVSAALERLQVSHLRRRLLSELSGGELQRVLLAFCTVHPRKLLVFDEPRTGLDPQAAVQLQELLQQLRLQEGLTILQITHDLSMVRRSSDWVLCLNRSLCCQGPPEHTLSREELERLYGRDYVLYEHSHHH